MRRRLLVIGATLAVTLAVGVGLVLNSGGESAERNHEDDPFQTYQTGNEDPLEQSDNSAEASPTAAESGTDDDDDADQGATDDVAPRHGDETDSEGTEQERPEAPTEPVERADISDEAETDDVDSDDERRPAELSREQVQEGMKAFRPVARECFQKTVEEFPEAEGRVVVDFAIEARDDEGRVFMSELGEDTTLFESNLHDCLLYNISEVEFEAPGNEGVVHISYPYNFAPASE